MRRIALLLLLSGAVASAHAQLQTEKRTVIYPETGEQGDLRIEPDGSFAREVDFVRRDYPVRRTLRVVGGVEMPGRFAPRGEEFFRQQEFLIDDNLDSLEVYLDSHSLYFKAGGDPFERHAYDRLTLHEGEWTRDHRGGRP